MAISRFAVGHQKGVSDGQALSVETSAPLAA
jgi:hypothetical protein